MSKIAAIGLAFVFILYLGGIESIYYFRIGDARTESQKFIQNNSIPSDNIEEFTLTASQYNSIAWLDRNKEFDNGGTRYDVLSLKFLQNDKVEIQCFADNKETSIVASFKGFMEKMFGGPVQSSKDNSSNISGKIYKEYTYNGRLVPLFFSKLLTAIRARCVLVNASSLVASIWHPPCN